MTLGKRLSTFRKLAGLTQTQLSERLSLSPQAISKWENDLSEPDIATLRALANLYEVSLGELVDLEGGFPDPIDDGEEVADEQAAADDTSSMRIMIGSDKTEAVPKKKTSSSTTTFYTDDLASKVVDEIENREKTRKDKEETDRKNAEHERRGVIMTKSLIWGIVISSIVAIVGTVLSVMALIESFDTGPLFAYIGVTYALSAFAFCMFFDTWVKDSFLWFATKVISFPGLIFEWSIDGFIWLIGMKLLFALLGFLFGVLMFFIGLAVASVVAMFTFPWLIFNIINDSRQGKIGEYVEII